MFLFCPKKVPSGTHQVNISFFHLQLSASIDFSFPATNSLGGGGHKTVGFLFVCFLILTNEDVLSFRMVALGRTNSDISTVITLV